MNLQMAEGKFYDNIYSAVWGPDASYWGIIGGIFGLLIFLIAVILAQPYSILTDPVSALGWSPNGSEPVFRIGMIILGILLAPYVFSLHVSFGQKVEKIRKRLEIYVI
jgi:hypothetical membrane protein